MMPQTLSELKIALKKRRLLAISFLLLPLPLLIMMAVQGNNFASIAQSGDQLKVGFVLLGFALLISTIVVQVFYTAQILTEPLNQPPLGFFKTLLYYLPGNFIILLMLQLLSTLPAILPKMLVNMFNLPSSFATLIELLFGVLLSLIAFELWFRFFRRHALRFQSKILLRRLIFKNHKGIIVLLWICISLTSLAPESGWSLAIVGTFDSIATLLLWEILGIELRALDKTTHTPQQLDPMI